MKAASSGRGNAITNDGPVEHLPKCVCQVVGEKRLHEETGAALVLGAFSQGCRSVASEQDDRNVSSSRLALQILDQLPSISAT